MDQKQRQLIKKYIDLALRRKKIIVIFFLVAAVVGLGMYLRTAKVYQCTSLIKYQRQRLNPTRMSSGDIKARTREVVATLSQEITSRTSLEAMIKEFNLYSGARSVMPMEDVVDMMRKNHIKISPDRGDIFKVSYQGPDPRKVLRVTNALAAQFIEENLRYREEMASKTSAYVREELAMAKKSINKKESVMRDYKLKYYNEMPDQRQNNMNRLTALQDQSQNKQDSLQDLERIRLLVLEQITLRREMLAQMVRQAKQGEIGAASLELLTPQKELAELNATLQNMLGRYTEKHPKIRRLRKRIEQLEQDQLQLLKPLGDGEEISSIPARPADQQLGQLQHQLDNIQYQLSRLKKEQEVIALEIEEYEKWIEAAPVREAEWTALTRDYQQLQSHYQAQVVRNLEAESAKNLEKRQQGSQFKIIDQAHFPEKPFQPDFRKIMIMALGLGLGLGCGLAFAVEFLDTSFKDMEELEDVLGLPVACTIPLINTSSELKRKKIVMIIWTVAFLLSSLVVLGLFAYCWRKGMIIL